jgi:Ca-activated chloride channel family protein
VSFASPLVLLALLAVPAALGAAALVARRRSRSPVAFTNLAVLEAVAPAQRRPRRRLIPIALLVLALAFAAGAAAHPQARVPVRVDNATIVLLVDVSGSMSARDVEPTRLDAAIAAMRWFVRRLPKDYKVGLVQFSDSSTVLAAPTVDHERIAQTLDLLMPDSGTAIGAGLLTAVAVAKSSLARDGVIVASGHRLPAAIVLLSDGKQTQGVISPMSGALRAKRAGIPVDTVALGTSHGVLGYGPFAKRVAPDAPLMRRIAKASGGSTATAHDSKQLTAFYQQVRGSFGTQMRTRDIASWFAAAAALLLAGAVGLGRLFADSLAS